MKKILVVDNHRVMLKFMADLLEEQGHKVLTAADGISALGILETFAPDIMFVDLIMPNIDGEKLCRIIRSQPRFKDIYIIILSAISAETSINVANFGADICIAKAPFGKMADNVIAVLENFGDRDRLSGRVVGLENIHPRLITKELLFSKKHFETLLCNMSEGILELTFDGKIVYANSAVISLIGIPEEKLLSSCFTDFFSGIDQKRIKKLIEKTGARPKTIDDRSPVLLNNRQVSVSVIPAVEDNQRIILVIINDVNHKKQMEAQLLQAHKMNAIAVLAGGIAHQFNNALAVVTGNIELLEPKCLKDKESINYIRAIQDSARKMVYLTNQLLAYARGGKYNPKTISLNSLINETLPLIQTNIDSDILFEKDLSDDLLKVKADYAQLQMVFNAILTNASEAIEKTGLIRIITRNEVVGEKLIKTHPYFKPGKYVSIVVEDNGKGMDDETIKKIFDPFFSRKLDGRGLGMAAAYGIVKNHGGYILVKSRCNKGTVVSIYLSAIDAGTIKKEEPSIKPAAGDGTILVIEDEAMVMDVISAILESLGYHVLKAISAKEALHIAGTHEGDIDLAVLDIILPEMSGKELYPLLMKKRPCLKVLVSSGFSLDGPAQEILNSGAQGFIQKPYDIAALSGKLKEILGTM